MASKADESCAVASKRPRDENDLVVESPEKKARASNDILRECHVKTNPVIVPVPPKSPSHVRSQPTADPSSASSLTIQIDGKDISNIMGSPPRLISSSQYLKIPPSPASPILAPINYFVDLKNKQEAPGFESSTKGTSVSLPTVTKPGKVRASCLLLILPLLLYWVATVSLGFWIAEKLDRELDAFGYRSSLRKAESKMKTLQMEHEHVISNWKQKVFMADQELRGFEQECNGMVEALERNLSQKKTAA